MTEDYPNRFRRDLINRLGVEAYNKFIEKIDETQLILDLIIEKLEEYNKQLKELSEVERKA